MDEFLAARGLAFLRQGEDEAMQESPFIRIHLDLNDD